MKITRLILILTAMGLLPLAPALAGSRDYGCRQKEERLERNLALARAANNPWRVAGLEKALEEVRRNCTEPRPQAKNDSKILDKEEKVRERQLELEKARAGGDAKKIAKREKKLREAQAELEEARTGGY